MRGCAPHCRRRKVRSAPFPSPSQAPHPSFRPCWPDLAHFAAPALPATQAWRGPQCETCARSLAPQGHFRAHSVGLGAPPLPTARGAAGAPLGLARKENGPYPQGVCRIRKRQSRQRLRDCTVQKKRALSALRCSGPPRATGVGVSVQAPILPGLRARYGLLRFL